jgi:hypothetical protein
MDFAYDIGKVPVDVAAFKGYLQDVLVDVQDVVVRDGEIIVQFPGAIRDNDKSTLDEMIRSYGGYVRVDRATEVKIREEWIKTGGNYRVEGLRVEGCVGGGAVTVGTYSWPYSISVLGLKLGVRAGNDGDVINGWVIPGSAVGVLMETVGEGVGSVKVSASVFDYIYKGYELIVGGVSMGEILGMDVGTGMVTTSGVVAGVAEIVAGAAVTFKRCVARNVRLFEGQMMAIGDLAVGTSYLPAGVNVVVEYKNNHSEVVDFDFMIEYFY